MSNNDGLYSNIPLRSFYNISNVDKISLFSGTADIYTKKGVRDSVDCNIYLDLHGRLNTVIDIYSSRKIDLTYLEDDIYIEREGFRYEIVFVSINESINSDSVSYFYQGFLEEPEYIGGDDLSQRVGRMNFLVFNFQDNWGDKLRLVHGDGYNTWLGRFKCEYESKWMITLDKVYDYSNVIDNADGKRYSVTHIGEIRRINNKLIRYKDVSAVFDEIYWFLSLLNGGRCSIGVFHGLRTLGYPILSNYCAFIPDSIHSPQTWLPSRYPVDIQEMLNRFGVFYKKKGASHWIRDFISLYTEANSEKSDVEINIVKAQIALELLCWIVLHEERSIISYDGLDRMISSDRIKILLSTLQIPIFIPDGMSVLKSYFPGTDGPTAITEIRNCVVHPSPRNRDKFLKYTDDVKYQCLDLILWYIEMCILKLLGYSNNYNNRLHIHGYGKRIELVPWMYGRK